MAKDKSKRAAAAAKRLENDTKEVKTPETIELNEKEVSKFINDAPLTTKNLNDSKTTVISFYVTKALKNELARTAAKKKVLKSKVIRAAENLYFNSELVSSSEDENLLEKKDQKVTCAFNKSELINRAKEKGFNRQTDYLNAVLINKLKEL